MNAEITCPPVDRLRRSLDPDDPMTEEERRRIEIHLESCQQGCQGVIAALIRGETVPDPTRTAIVPRSPAAVLARDDSADMETATLLRRRLIVIFTILAVMGCGGALAEMVNEVQYQWWHWVMPILWAGLVIVMAVRPLSLTTLRICELVGFGVLWMVDTYWTALVGNAATLRAQPEGRFAIAFPAFAISLLWFALISMYGIAVPNTWRRAATVIGLMTATPFTVLVCVWWSDAPPARVQTEFLTTTSFWILEGSVIALFASHKLAQYRRAAAEARQLGPYTLVRPLGAGGMGEVYLAQHRLLKRPCAVKLVRADQTTQARMLSRFEREVQATAGLTHPNSVQVFDYGKTPDGTFYYAMEYLPGLNLQDMVARHGPLPVGRVVYLLRQVCGALREAHAAGLIHRDIKPGNVIVCERGGMQDVAKLLDFGLVRDVSGTGAMTQDGTIAGTPAYMSPEQVTGASLDGRSDIYALGALAYFLLTGRPPFADPSPLKAAAAQLYEIPDPPSRHCPNLPADVEAIVLRCLAKAPWDRFPDVSSVDEALGACASAGDWSGREAAAWWRGKG